jgi:hypothetical protein
VLEMKLCLDDADLNQENDYDIDEKERVIINDGQF